jgi:hypothetical protein
LIVAVHQPQYLPWLGYFHKMMQADVFCYLDNVQYKKNEWQNRNRIKTAQNWQWITVPVCFRFPQRINEVEINTKQPWFKKHLQALVTNYSKAPYFEDYFSTFEACFCREWKWLFELNIFLIEHLRELLGLQQKQTLLASELSLSNDPTGRLVDICKSVGADTYLAGRDGANYMDLEQFEKNSINVVFQEFQHPVYPQLFNGFQSHLSLVDLLFNCGPQSLEIIRTANP